MRELFEHPNRVLVCASAVLLSGAMWFASFFGGRRGGTPNAAATAARFWFVYPIRVYLPAWKPTPPSQPLLGSSSG